MASNRHALPRHRPAAVWSADGREVFYRGLTAMMAVPVRTEPSFSAGIGEPLFEDVYSNVLGPRDYDVAEDGRFLMLKPEASPRDAAFRNSDQLPDGLVFLRHCGLILLRP